MLRPRTSSVLNSIVRRYIETALPVSSSAVLSEIGLNVCSATIRNEMALLEEEGYIGRPHHAAGSVPLDKGYRYYVGNLAHIGLPVVEQMLINHLFHQVEDEIEEWMELAGSLLAQQVKSLALVTRPAAPSARFKHLELISLQPNLALLVMVLEGARVKQQLVNLEMPMSQQELSAASGKLTERLKGKNVNRIEADAEKQEGLEKSVIEAITRLMHAETRESQQESYIDGLPYLLGQPEFSRGDNLGTILSLVEQKRLAKLMNLSGTPGYRVNVVIGQENESRDARDFSLVLSRYGIADEFSGTIGVFGPTRMHYEKAIALVGYLSLIMSKLVAELYGKEVAEQDNNPEQN
ncbi:MAG: heat-inducible transcription repressor HrcA [Dehalococcoidaceae bacterium]|nr:heat-inducible transcription repressor HrcA [Dehalococcoidaceae bacterium]